MNNTTRTPTDPLHMRWKVRAKDLWWWGCGYDRRKATKLARKAYKTGRPHQGVDWDQNLQLVLPDHVPAPIFD